jgi:hypothetical protein
MGWARVKMGLRVLSVSQPEYPQLRVVVFSQPDRSGAWGQAGTLRQLLF